MNAIGNLELTGTYAEALKKLGHNLESVASQVSATFISCVRKNCLVFQVLLCFTQEQLDYVHSFVTLCIDYYHIQKPYVPYLLCLYDSIWS